MGDVISGVLNTPVIIETEDELIAFPAGSRVRVQADPSWPSLVTDASYDELERLLEAFCGR